MEASKVIFTKEFKEKTMKGLSRRRIGELRWEKLLQVDEQGALQEVHNRKGMGGLVGITKPKAYNSWVASLIKKGRLSETLRGFENGKATYEYHIESREVAMPLPKKKPTHIASVAEPQKSIEPQHVEQMTVTMTFKNAILKIENATASAVIEIIKAMDK